MLRYEMLILTVPEITADEANTIESQINSIIDDAKGSVISYERWGKYRLAYPIRNYEYGVYFLVRYEVNQEGMHQLLNNLHTYFAVKQTELVMRHMITKLANNASLDYKKPESLEDIPTRDINTFLKENKMTGLLNPSSSSEELDDLDQAEAE